jgi:hypothetical protein
MPLSEEESLLDYFNPKRTKPPARLPPDNLFLGVVVLLLGVILLAFMLLVLLEEASAVHEIGYWMMLMSVAIPAGVMMKLGIALIRRRDIPSLEVKKPTDL